MFIGDRIEAMGLTSSCTCAVGDRVRWGTVILWGC